MGDLLEAVAIAVMRGAGIELEKIQEPVKLKIGNTELGGTYDVKIDGRVWDIKSASPSSFMSKFGEFGSYTKIKGDDPFGYIMQGHLYGEADNVPFGGWIAINKVTGEFAVCEAPVNQEEDRKEVLQTANENINALESNKKFEKFVDKMYNSNVAELKVVENFEFNGWYTTDDDVFESEDTMSILNKYVEEADITLDKSLVQKMLQEVGKV